MAIPPGPVSAITGNSIPGAPGIPGVSSSSGSTSNFLTLPNDAQLNIKDTSAQFPAWFQAYQQSILAKGSQIAGEPYQAFPGARIAAPTDDQMASWDQIRNLNHSIQPLLDKSWEFTQAGGKPAGTDASKGYYEMAADSSAREASDPFVSQAGALADDDFTQNYGKYLNPFANDVLSRKASLLSRNLTENILPNLNSTFTGNGSFGSSRQFDFTNRAIRDTQEALAGTAGDTLSQGWNTAGQLYGQDATRKANLTLGAGNLASSAAQADAALLGQIGTSAGQLAAGDASRSLEAGRDAGGLAQLANALRISQAGALNASGQEQRQIDQASLDQALKDFTEQRDYPLKQLAILQSLMSGQPIPGSGTTSTSAGPAPSTSPLATLAGLAVAGTSAIPKT